MFFPWCFCEIFVVLQACLEYFFINKKGLKEKQKRKKSCSFVMKLHGKYALEEKVAFQGFYWKVVKYFIGASQHFSSNRTFRY